ncbi:hypothetical protein BSKO_07341 [Bryopsis sp. KO-2023]|nr:hypothetical protein BSKO_07341 [Bryopsis sp. KO-2023]
MAVLPSLTGLVCLAGLAWLIRLLRRAQADEEEVSSDQGRANGHGTLSADSLAMLINTDPVPHYIIDVRDAFIIAQSPAPALLKNGPGTFMCIAADDVRKLFLRRGSGDFARKFPQQRYPNKDDLLVFVSDDVEQSRKATDDAQALGFSCAVYLERGLASFRDNFQPALADVKYLSRHAVAVILGMVDSFTPVEATVIDLRRADELVVFGTIDKTKQLPVGELPRALKMEEGEFRDKYQFSKPRLDDVLVLSCRTNRRSSWGFQIFTEAGFTRVFVHRTGVYGWQFSSSVKKYESYEKGDEFPKAIPFEVERPDRNTGLRELAEAGLISRAKSEPSRPVLGASESGFDFRPAPSI